MSDSIVRTAQEAALRSIEESHVICLSAEEQLRFAERLLNPPEPSPALKRAKEAHGRLIQER